LTAPYIPVDHLSLYLSILPRPPSSTLFPYTTLFRSLAFRNAFYFGEKLERIALRLGFQLRIQLKTVPNQFYFISVWKLLHCFFQDRKSTRLNSSHVKISYAVFCLKKKMKSADVACC